MVHLSSLASSSMKGTLSQRQTITPSTFFPFRPFSYFTASKDTNAAYGPWRRSKTQSSVDLPIRLFVFGICQQENPHTSLEGTLLQYGV